MSVALKQNRVMPSAEKNVDHCFFQSIQSQNNIAFFYNAIGSSCAMIYVPVRLASTGE
jgi:hypothetical protein